MLVLSRRVNDKIVLPSIQTMIQVVSVKSGTVRIGIEAPPHIQVYREEILQQLNREQLEAQLAIQARESDMQELIHQLNNRLNSSSIGLALLRRQLELGMSQEMENTLTKMEQEIEGLKETLESVHSTSQPQEQEVPRRRCALLVEDDVNECELLAGFLRLAGLDVVTAGDGGDALDYLNNHHRPDLLLLDMFLPRTDGPTTVREIRRNPANQGLKIFGVTGADPKKFELPLGPAGIDRWFTKPLNPQTLLVEMKRELDCQVVGGGAGST